MIRLLLVDDDPGLLRGLQRLLSWRRKDLHLGLASDGEEAIEILKREDYDAVLTDLHMPHVDGFALLAWVMSHAPHIAVFAMTAMADEKMFERMGASSSIQCFTKPLDLDQLLVGLDAAMSDGMSGHLRNISPVALLQLMEMEQKTCALIVRSGAEVGRMYLERGTLVHASSGDLTGDDAAIEIATWSKATIQIDTGASVTATVTSPLRFIVMEACRLMDERADTRDAELGDDGAGGGDKTGASDSFGDGFGDSFVDGVGDGVDELDAAFAESMIGAEPAGAGNDSHVSFEAVGRNGLPAPAEPLDATAVDAPPAVPVLPRLPGSADALAVVERDTGVVQHQLGDCVMLRAAAQLASGLLRAKLAALDRLGLPDALEEMVITTGTYASVIRPIAIDCPRFALLVFDPSRTTLGMERLALDGFMSEARAWLTAGLP